MKRIPPLAVFVICCFLVIFWAGCASVPANKDKEISKPELLEPQSALKFSDIPVPVGFKFIPEDSYSFESSGVRVGLLKYKGKVNLDYVVNFYKEQMPMYNWNLLNSIEYGQRVLNFDREQESCIIAMASKGSSTVLTISLGPKSRMPKKQDKPIK